jgi:catechol 2,3-dioxygenase-like lactoylglutathione lyase family enzyme
MKPWYSIVLGVQPFFEHNPPAGAAVGDFGGQTRAADLRMCFFRLSVDYPFTQVIGIFEEPAVSAAVSKSMPGLHHMQLMSEGLDTLVEKYEALASAGMRPHRTANHGPMTSFYYRDPDGNNVELTAQNFATFELMAEFMRSAAFKANPSGVELDPEVFVSRYRSGVPAAELTRIPD